MKKINYKMSDGSIVEIEVNDVTAEILQEEKRYFWKIHKREKRNESIASIERREENGEQVTVDVKPSPLDILIEQEDEDEQERLKLLLPNAIAQLTERQQEMVRLVFFENKTQAEVAEHFGIAKQSMSDAMKRIYATLKKILEK